VLLLTGGPGSTVEDGDCLIFGVSGRPDREEQAVMDTTEMIDPVTGEIIDEQQFAEQLLKQAREQGGVCCTFR
jgi:hypothetical protein